MTEAPLISVCVPTHDGRRETLRSLLMELCTQRGVPPGALEICVSDNASNDGTQAMVEEAAANARWKISYERHELDRGLAPNLLSAIALARGRYCWLMSSDDLLAPGAVARACRLIEQLPDMTGYVVGSVYVDAVDHTLRSRQLPRAFFPPGDEPAAIRGITEIYERCGNAWIALSWSVVQRTAWDAAVERWKEMALRHPVYPHVVLLAMAARSRPEWGWLPQTLVLQRNAPTFLFEASESALANRWARLIGDLAAVWAEIHGGRRTRAWRRQMEIVAQVWGTLDDVRATKLYETPSIAAQLRLSAVLARSLWPSAAFRRRVLGASLLPVWYTRARHSPDGGMLQGRSRLAGRSIRLAGDLPHRMATGAIAHISIEVTNLTRSTITSTGVGAVALAQRWWTADGRALTAGDLMLNAAAALPQTLPYAVRAGRTLECEVVIYAPTDLGAYRVELTAMQPGRWLDEAGVAATLTASVEVVQCAQDVPAHRSMQTPSV